MNKEEIEKAKQCLNEIIQNTYAEGKAKKLDILRKYIKELEQKESILDKVTDKLKEDINRFDKVIKDRRIWGEQKVDFKKYKNYAINLLNIIEGEKK